MTHFIDDQAFWEHVAAARDHQDYQRQYTSVGPQPHVIVSYSGTGYGAPKYRCLSASDWERHQEYGWEIIATVDAAGEVQQA